MKQISMLSLYTLKIRIRQVGIMPEAIYSCVGPGADVILRSSDGVKLRAHKLILSHVSTVFRDMFENGASPKLPDTEPDSELPIVDLSESQHDVYQILHYRDCYPIPHRPLTQLQDIVSVLNAATKYDMQGVSSFLTYSLRPFRKTEPLQVFPLACRYNFEGLACDAAQLRRASYQSTCQ